MAALVISEASYWVSVASALGVGILVGWLIRHWQGDRSLEHAASAGEFKLGEWVYRVQPVARRSTDGLTKDSDDNPDPDHR